MKFGEEFSTKYNLSSLKVLGTVGEPINPEAWLWYHKFVGHENAAIVDTYWQVRHFFCHLNQKVSVFMKLFI
jgi:acetyl-CoA synthetase